MRGVELPGRVILALALSVCAGCIRAQHDPIPLATQKPGPPSGGWTLIGDCEYKTVVLETGSRIDFQRGVDGGDCPGYEGLLQSNPTGDF